MGKYLKVSLLYLEDLSKFPQLTVFFFFFFVLVRSLHIVKEETFKTYESVKRLKELKNRQPVRKREAILAAILYIVCRNQNSPRTFSEICTASGVKRGDVGTYYRLMLKILEPSQNATASARNTDAEAFMVGTMLPHCQPCILSQRQAIPTDFSHTDSLDSLV